MFSSPPPLAPPTTEEDSLRWLRLIRSARVGSSTFFRLMAEHGSAQAALEALPEVARASGVKKYTPCPPDVAEAEFAAAHKVGAQLLCYGDPAYPQNLMNIPDAPPLLWAKGQSELLNQPSIALVGARNASSLGLRMAKALAKGLGQANYVIISGLARGIDTVAHQAALATGTVAVMAGGVDVIYPSENNDLAKHIMNDGVLLSEQPIGLTPQARHFPRRNRIVSGLSRAVVVVEAAAKSGSLITARLALDQGREVMAVPGHPFDGRAAGCNILIRDGAPLVRGAEDVLTALGAPPADPKPRNIAPSKTPNEPRHSVTITPISAKGDLPKAILSLLGSAPIPEDELIRDLGLAPQRVAETLLELELNGQIERRSGGLLSLAG